ncbi:hypothetical protein VNI00_010442 [Paramarasmius palmivorus]|uniref:Uncharacterized protein n=1 Tax=Paramarasmius palmivorus TaxID=297713 RepID=A0AAW0CIT4_9AGAR
MSLVERAFHLWTTKAKQATIVDAFVNEDACNNAIRYALDRQTSVLSKLNIPDTSHQCPDVFLRNAVKFVSECVRRELEYRRLGLRGISDSGWNGPWLQLAPGSETIPTVVLRGQEMGTVKERKRKVAPPHRLDVRGRTRASAAAGYEEGHSLSTIGFGGNGVLIGDVVWAEEDLILDARRKIAVEYSPFSSGRFPNHQLVDDSEGAKGNDATGVNYGREFDRDDFGMLRQRVEELERELENCARAESQCQSRIETMNEQFERERASWEREKTVMEEKFVEVQKKWHEETTQRGTCGEAGEEKLEAGEMVWDMQCGDGVHAQLDGHDGSPEMNENNRTGDSCMNVLQGVDVLVSRAERGSRYTLSYDVMLFNLPETTSDFKILGNIKHGVQSLAETALNLHDSDPSDFMRAIQDKVEELEIEALLDFQKGEDCESDWQKTMKIISQLKNIRDWIGEARIWSDSMKLDKKDVSNDV